MRPIHTSWTKAKLLLVFNAFCVLAVLGCVTAQGPQQAGPTESAPGATADPKRIVAIHTSQDDQAIKVHVTGNRSLTYTSVKQPFPTSVILYFPETALLLESVKTEHVQDSDVIGAVKTSELTEKGTTARVEIALKKDVAYQVNREGDGLVVSFDRSAVSSGSAATAVKEQTIAPESTAAPAAPLQSATTLSSVTASAIPGGVEIKVRADGAISDYKSFTVNNPDRIVFDMNGLKSPSTKEQLVAVNAGGVKQARHYGYPDRVRLVLDASADALNAFKADPVADGLVIRIGKGATASSSASPVLAAANPTSNPSPKSGAHGSAWVNRIDFASEEKGKSTVVIGTTTTVAYDVKKAGDRRLQVKLFNTRLPDYHQRPLVTTRFESAVDRITPVSGSKDSAVVAIEMRQDVPYVVEQADSLLMIHFEASTIAPKPLAESGLASLQQVTSQTVKTAEPAMPTPVVAATDDIQTAPVVGGRPGDTRRYTGEKIALDFYDTDIKNVFRILREVSGKNFAVDKEVTGKVTLSLDKPVPWDQVMDLVLRMNRLGSIMEGDIIRIATLETIKAEDELRRAEKTVQQEEKAKEKSLEPLVTEYIPVNYANAKTDVLPQVKSLLTKDRGTAEVDERNNQIVVTDTADVLRKAKETIQRIDKVTPQVLIEARIVEATNSFSRAFGTSLSGTITTSDINTQRYALTATNPSASPLGTLGMTFTRASGIPFGTISATLTASESKGLVKIISSPKILTLDNKAATIKQGVSYPLNKLDADGNTTTTFQDVALELEVTPHVTPDNRISMKIKIANNEIGAVINNQTSFTTKEANTELLVNDGDTVIIGGIRKTREDDGGSGLPGLRNVPVLGWLFGTKSKSETKEEMLIFITPRIYQLAQSS